MKVYSFAISLKVLPQPECTHVHTRAYPRVDRCVHEGGGHVTWRNDKKQIEGIRGKWVSEITFRAYLLVYIISGK